MVRPGRKYHRGRYWIQQRDAAFARAGGKCEITGEPLVRRAAHHVLCERWVRLHLRGADPHLLDNLVIVGGSLHARLGAIESKLFKKADYLGFRIGMYRVGMPLEMIDRAFSALCASVKK